MTNKSVSKPGIGRVALVTGASSGIGEATARELHAAGYIVYAGARRLELMQPLAELGINVIALDVTSETSMRQAIDGILSAHQRFDLLVNNAGYGSYGAVEDVPIDEARHQFEVNIFGMARLTQLVLPTMRQQRRGAILNISSIGGKFGEPLGAWYHASKYAMEGYSDSLGLELAAFGIRVVCIEPGNIKTEWGTIAMDNLAATSGDGPYKDLVKRRQSAMARLGERNSGAPPESVAQAIRQIAELPRPKYRYPVAGGAPIILLLRRVLPDRLFYAAIKRFLT